MSILSWFRRKRNPCLHEDVTVIKDPTLTTTQVKCLDCGFVFDDGPYCPTFIPCKSFPERCEVCGLPTDHHPVATYVDAQEFIEAELAQYYPDWNKEHGEIS